MDLTMIVFLIIFLAIILYKAKIGKNINNSFFEKEQSKVIKGICCIIVFLVHVPKEHGNAIQDAIGSFGYICVTIFFLLSAYGLKYSINNKKDYLKHFFRNRIISIYIPFVIANTLWQLLGFEDGIDIWAIIGIDSFSFIGELIIFYLLFYIIYKNIDNKKADFIMIGATLVISIVSYVFQIGWFVECLGFAYGIIFYNLEERINNYFKKSYLKKVLSLCIISLILGTVYIRLKNIIILNYIFKILLGISIVGFLIYLFKKVKLNNKILTFLGNISFEIYLLHEIIMKILIGLNISSGCYIVTSLLLTIILACIMNYIDMKITKAIKYNKR